MIRIALERLLNPKFDPEFVPRAAHDPKVLNAEVAKSETPSEEKKKLNNSYKVFPPTEDLKIFGFSFPQTN